MQTKIHRLSLKYRHLNRRHKYGGVVEYKDVAQQKNGSLPALLVNCTAVEIIARSLQVPTTPEESQTSQTTDENGITSSIDIGREQNTTCSLSQRSSCKTRAKQPNDLSVCLFIIIIGRVADRRKPNGSLYVPFSR